MDKFVITKKEWHYKLLLFFMRDEFNIQYTCKDFCSYWRVFVMMVALGTVIFAAATTFLVYLIFSTVFILILQPFYGWVSSFEHQFLVGAILTGIISFIVSVVLLWRRYDWGAKIAAFFESIFEGIDDWRSARVYRKHAKLEAEEQNPTPPSIFRQWLRNTRDKVCVGIEYVNEK